MSNLNNISKVNELSTIELIFNFWKFKKIFFYILVPVLILSFLFESLLPKKNIVQVRFADPLLVNLDIYPFANLYNLELDLTSIHLEKIIVKSKKENLNYYRYYLRDNLLSANNLINFAKMNDEEYNLYNYINNKKLSVEMAIINKVRDEKTFNLTLPASSNSEKFFNEYLIYIHSLSIDKLKKSLLDFENKNLKLLEKEEVYIDFLINSINANYKNTEMNDINENTIIMKNILLIQNFHREKRKHINENINLIKNFKKELSSEILLDGPIIREVSAKLNFLLQYFIPIILSLIIYLFYILIKLTKIDPQN